MKTEIIRKKDIKEINDDLKLKQRELIDLKFDLKIGKEKDYSKVKKIRREVAKILTIIKENNTMNLVKESDKIETMTK
jgi:ribosomal protein L29